MFRIINVETSEVIGMTSEVNYIRRKPSSGVLIKATPADADGIAWHSEPYNLSGREGVGAEITVVVNEFDGAEEIAAIDSKAEVVKKTIGGNRADRLYEAGEYLAVNGALYRVTLEIPAGTMVAVGTNVEETDIAKELSKLI